jgi:quercetin dioxygenase-like cupin family protein
VLFVLISVKARESMNALNQRVFDVEKLVQFSDVSDDKGKVTELAVTKTSSLAVWGVRPGQKVPTHTHPDGQDTWIMVKGELTYYLGNGQRQTIAAGQIDIAEQSQVHGALNEGVEDAVFISIYSAPNLKVYPATP